MIEFPFCKVQINKNEMNRNGAARSAFLILVILVLASGCKKEEPTMTTNAVKDITAATAITGGKIVFDGRSKILSSGICWDTVSAPTIAKWKLADSIPGEEFELIIKGLLPAKTYYVRAYAENSIGTGYGEELSFTTLTSVPIVRTVQVTDFMIDSAKSGGLIVSDGGLALLNCGVCWDTVAGPLFSGFKTSDSTGSNEFASIIHGLLPNTKYFFRAYATNSMGTGYGQEIEYKTPKIIPLVSTKIISEKYLYSASAEFTLKTDGGSKIIEFGFCWDIKPYPTTDSWKVSKPYAPGMFRLTNLKAGTKYYARPYAINEEGTGYGEMILFKTLGNPPGVTTGEASDLTANEATVKGIVAAGFLPTVISFEYGVTDNYGQSSEIKAPPLKGNDKTTFVSRLTDLKSGNTYHFRIKATNSLGTTYGKDQTFTILRVPDLKGFTPISKNYRDTEFIIPQPTSNSPGMITYSSSNPNVLLIKNDKAVITGSGTCTITATQTSFGIFSSGSVSTTFSMNVVDIDGNVYKTIPVGEQDWMKENLRVTRYRNGEPIPNVKNKTEWISITEGAFCWINNDTSTLNNSYGALYNWYAVDSRKICPVGWHVPTDAEWQVMERYLGMSFSESEETTMRSTNIGQQLKDTVGWIKNGNGTNSTDFTAHPAGLRTAASGDFFNTGIDAVWWTATEEDTYNAWLRNVYYYYNSIYRAPESKNNGFSVRCVRDKKQY
jgi:uncharacterized protein (TIGR02145 family)